MLRSGCRLELEPQRTCCHPYSCEPSRSTKCAAGQASQVDEVVAVARIHRPPTTLMARGLQRRVDYGTAAPATRIIEMLVMVVELSPEVNVKVFVPSWTWSSGTGIARASHP
jgi:hypothetical protein